MGRSNSSASAAYRAAAAAHEHLCMRCSGPDIAVCTLWQTLGPCRRLHARRPMRPCACGARLWPDAVQRHVATRLLSLKCPVPTPLLQALPLRGGSALQVSTLGRSVTAAGRRAAAGFGLWVPILRVFIHFSWRTIMQVLVRANLHIYVTENNFNISINVVQFYKKIT